ncbi:DNA polymerase III subunit chi [Allofrancisella guangzhouensis]|uniref:DNA polymerase III subunit chi n=1 Tax=Allofrancisella guangzhouensis TaxID=594679 RepID=A0A0A8E3G2_9GAMM|nr:DNA polymerase III subunit chi [Allofrancisella guangzhouensis]AJC48528.1 DNA polymerase III subunit chi [Allofrancisella guangzhouensis]MBK2027812.1 DNA polymerase III subunit chi [Allofrancisella guangzhouensis]MBK2044802.1 DNA polymerase III subunit chi [Allofrancisella guangzhouensis]MBK2045747.1 DNA polymerase III subunit chi [Allofrancisella guangzhouensis]
MRVEFHVLQIDDLAKILEVIARRIISVYEAGKTVVILAPGVIAKKLDNKLWQAGEESFIPHFCATNAKDYNTFRNIPVLITDNMFITSGFDELINLIDIPLELEKISIGNLIEFVYQDENVLGASRKKYIFYKKLGLNIDTIKY